MPAARTAELSTILSTIKKFLSSCREPALLEEGEESIALAPNNHSIECRRGRLVMEAWDSHRNITRRVLDVEEERPGRLALLIERFGKRQGRITLYDQARPGNSVTSQKGARLVGRELLRRALSRQFPGWRIATVSAEAQLENSLSPAYPRAFLTSGSTAWAAIAAPLDCLNPDGVLTYGLIWLDYLRRREPALSVEGLALFLPEGRERTTCLRLRHLDPSVAHFRVFSCAVDGWEQPIDPRDHGNLDTRLEICRTPVTTRMPGNGFLEAIGRQSGVEQILVPDGSISLRVRGIEFARFRGGTLEYGLQQRREAADKDLPEIQRLAVELARLRSPEVADRSSPLYSASPEAWLESRVRAGIETVVADLFSGPVYGQVPAFAGGERGMIDLLALDHRGRLAVLELKATADPHLPLQALDYWIRVRFHLARGEFSERGYFPSQQLAPEVPRMILLAPALEFHPTTESILRFFSPEIPVERIGVGMDWRRDLRVVFRATGSERPGI